MAHLEFVLELSLFGRMFGLAVLREFNEFTLPFPSEEVLILIFGGLDSSPCMGLDSRFSPLPSSKDFVDCWNFLALIRLSLSPWVRTLPVRLFLAFSEVCEGRNCRGIAKCDCQRSTRDQSCWIKGYIQEDRSNFWSVKCRNWKIAPQGDLKCEWILLGEGNGPDNPTLNPTTLHRSYQKDVKQHATQDLEDESRYLNIFLQLEIPLWVCVWESCPAARWFSQGWAAVWAPPLLLCSRCHPSWSPSCCCRQCHL